MYLLDFEDYKKVLPLVSSADMNTLFALSVLMGKTKGSVYVDNREQITSVYIKHSYGMALLCGESNSESYYSGLNAYIQNKSGERKQYEWLQVYPNSMNDVIRSIFAEDLIKKDPNQPYLMLQNNEESNKVLEFQRVNFRFNKALYLKKRKELITDEYEVKATSADMFEKLEGLVVPKDFWNSKEEFVQYGAGYTLIHDNQPAATAFAAYMIGDKLEIGIETMQGFRRNGFAARVCAELIEYCLQKGYEPVWSCNSSNIGSRKLAYKLGFEETKRLPYYRIP